MVFSFLLALFVSSAMADAPEPDLFGLATPVAVPVATVRLPVMPAQDVNAAARGSVFRLSTNFSGANERAMHGTAFVVDKSGLLLTNFHVVRDSLLEGEDMKLYLEVGGQSVGIRVLDVDVVNDLALVRAAKTFETSLAVADPASVSEGEVVYSLGFPANDQLTFIQGNYGGEKPVGFVNAGFAAIGLNSGMSGGPMLNSRAEVIGVNRAIIRNAQDLSYFSPLGAVRDLVSKGSGRNIASISNWRSEAVAAVRRQEKITLAGKVEPRREKLGGLSFLVPLPNQKCGQTREHSHNASSEMLVCHSNSLTPLVKDSNALEVITMAAATGNSFGHSSPSMEAAVRQLYDQERLGILDKKSKGDKDESCGLRNVKNTHGVEMTVSYCSLANHFYDGLFSTFVRVEVRGAAGVTALGQMYQGLSSDATAEVLGQFLESIQEEGT